MYVSHYMNHFSSASWGFPILAAAAFVRLRDMYMISEEQE
jgi:hypothetical protein